MTARDLGHAIADYFEAKGQVLEGFGVPPTWREVPLDDRRADHWMLVDGERHCAYSPEPFTLAAIEAGERVYSGPVYTQRGLPKYVFRAGGYVLVSVDTQTDGNVLRMVFDAAKECTDEALRDAYRERWA